jgi:hypothetical protein
MTEGYKKFLAFGVKIELAAAGAFLGAVLASPFTTQSLYPGAVVGAIFALLILGRK